MVTPPVGTELPSHSAACYGCADVPGRLDELDGRTLRTSGEL